MPYILAAVFILAFGCGFGVARSVYVRQVEGLESTITAGNALAEKALSESKAKLASAEKQANDMANQLDKAHEQDIITINALHSDLSGTRLRDPGIKGCRNAMPKSVVAAIDSHDAGDGAELSEEFASFLKSEALRADMAAADKAELLKFVKGGCGIL